jgi:hypothetical protein
MRSLCSADLWDLRNEAVGRGASSAVRMDTWEAFRGRNLCGLRAELVEAVCPSTSSGHIIGKLKSLPVSALSPA